MSWTTEFEDILSPQAPLAERTWLGIGGPAQWLAIPSSPEQLSALIARCRDEEIPVRLLGSGSNLLVRESGVAGVVVNLSAACFSQIEIDRRVVKCGGGTRLSHLISESVGAGLAGLEPLVGIPGTVGGALHGNAGGHGGDIGQRASQATVLTRSGELIQRQRQDMVFAYRESSLDELVIVEAQFELDEDDPVSVAKRMQKQWIATRASQPMSHERTACLFRDPQALSAESLIEQAGLKGTTVGGVELSSRHSNFIVAHPGAKSDDVLALIEQIRDQVSQQTGIELQTHLEIW